MAKVSRGHTRGLISHRRASHTIHSRKNCSAGNLRDALKRQKAQRWHNFMHVPVKRDDGRPAAANRASYRNLRQRNRRNRIRHDPKPQMKAFCNRSLMCDTRTKRFHTFCDIVPTVVAQLWKSQRKRNKSQDKCNRTVMLSYNSSGPDRNLKQQWFPVRKQLWQQISGMVNKSREHIAGGESARWLEK